jgi:hypothetical protein
MRVQCEEKRMSFENPSDPLLPAGCIVAATVKKHKRTYCVRANTEKRVRHKGPYMRGCLQSAPALIVHSLAEHFRLLHVANTRSAGTRATV